MKFSSIPDSVNQPTFDEWFSLPPVQLLSINDPQVWQGLNICTAQMNPTERYYLTPATEDDCLVFTLAGENFIEFETVDGDRFKQVLPSGTLQLHPRNSIFSSRWKYRSSAAFVQIPRQITNEIIATLGQGDPDRIELPFTLAFRDLLLSHLTLALIKQLNDASFMAGLHAENVIRTIASHMLQEYSNIRLRDIKEAGLTIHQKRVVEEYIYENLHMNFSIADLATTIYVSPTYFHKLFRTTYQSSPYQYILKCRIEKAIRLLSNRQLSLCEVSIECGFANQSHFTRHFSKQVGISPARFVAIDR